VKLIHRAVALSIIKTQLICRSTEGPHGMDIANRNRHTLNRKPAILSQVGSPLLSMSELPPSVYAEAIENRSRSDRRILLTSRGKSRRLS
jgi:hypothetical protein